MAALSWFAIRCVVAWKVAACPECGPADVAVTQKTTVNWRVRAVCHPPELPQADQYPPRDRERFGWIKPFGGLRQFKQRSQANVIAAFDLHRIASNMIRLGNLLRPLELEA